MQSVGLVALPEKDASLAQVNDLTSQNYCYITTSHQTRRKIGRVNIIIHTRSMPLLREVSTGH